MIFSFLTRFRSLFRSERAPGLRAGSGGVLLTLFLLSCRSFPAIQKDLFTGPEWSGDLACILNTEGDLQKPGGRVPLSFFLPEIEGNQHIMKNVKEIYREAMEKGLQKNCFFTSAKPRSSGISGEHDGSGGYRFDIYFRRYFGIAPFHGVSGSLSVMTFTVLPGYERSEVRMDAVLYWNGNYIKTYELVQPMHNVYTILWVLVPVRKDREDRQLREILDLLLVQLRARLELDYPEGLPHSPDLR